MSENVSDEDLDRSALEAEAEVLPERELMALIAPDSGADQASDAADTVTTDAEGDEQNSQSDSASTTS